MVDGKWIINDMFIAESSIGEGKRFRLVEKNLKKSMKY